MFRKFYSKFEFVGIIVLSLYNDQKNFCLEPSGNASMTVQECADHIRKTCLFLTFCRWNCVPLSDISLQLSRRWMFKYIKCVSIKLIYYIICTIILYSTNSTIKLLSTHFYIFMYHREIRNKIFSLNTIHNVSYVIQTIDDL